MCLIVVDGEFWLIQHKKWQEKGTLIKELWYRNWWESVLSRVDSKRKFIACSHVNNCTGAKWPQTYNPFSVLGTDWCPCLSTWQSWNRYPRPQELGCFCCCGLSYVMQKAEEPTWDCRGSAQNCSHSKQANPERWIETKPEILAGVEISTRP